MLITGLIISVIFNFLLLIAAFFWCIRSVELEARCEFYREQWSKWEQEYWMVRSLSKNTRLKLSWLADGKVETEEEFENA